MTGVVGHLLQLIVIGTVLLLRPQQIELVARVFVYGLSVYWVRDACFLPP